MMTWLLCHTTKYWNENNSMMLRKKVIIVDLQQYQIRTMFSYNQYKNSNDFTCKFIVSKEAGLPLTNKDNKCSTSQA